MVGCPVVGLVFAYVTRQSADDQPTACHQIRGGSRNNEETACIRLSISHSPISHTPSKTRLYICLLWLWLFIYLVDNNILVVS